MKGLGNFVEIEAIDDSGVYTAQELQQQCTGYMEKFNIQQQDLISTSYSDMLPGSGAV